ncbi:30S ribosomal protein S20 [bacterium]|nr:30S ribosomal protein S20 [bacterium]
MPQHKSCEKRMRTSAKARIRNRSYRGQMKRAIRSVREAGNKEEAQTNLKKAMVVLDSLAGKGIIHKNRAADKKSRLNAFVQAMPS